MKLKKTAVDAVSKAGDLVSDNPVNKVKSLSRFVPKAVTRSQGRAIVKLQKHSPAILFGVGIVAGVGTVVTACQSTLKLEEVLDELDHKKSEAKRALKVAPADYSERDYKKDMAVIHIRSIVKLGRLYAVPAALGVVSVAALTGSHHILSSRNVAVSAAYAAADRAFNEYHERVVGEFGEEKGRELRYGVSEHEVVEETKNGPVKKKVKSFGEGRSPYARVFDEVTSRNWKSNPASNRMFIQGQQVWCNDLLQTRGHLFLNEVFDYLGMERTPEGQVVGWALNGPGDDFVSFGLGFDSEEHYQFMTGQEASVLLDFNVNGKVYDLL